MANPVRVFVPSLFDELVANKCRRVLISATSSEYYRPPATRDWDGPERPERYKMRKIPLSVEKLTEWLDEQWIEWEVISDSKLLQNALSTCLSVNERWHAVVITHKDPVETVRTALALGMEHVDHLYLEYPKDPILAEQKQQIRWLLRHSGDGLLRRFRVMRLSQRAPASFDLLPIDTSKTVRSDSMPVEKLPKPTPTIAAQD